MRSSALAACFGAVGDERWVVALGWLGVGGFLGGLSCILSFFSYSLLMNLDVSSLFDATHARGCLCYTTAASFFHTLWEVESSLLSQLSQL